VKIYEYAKSRNIKSKDVVKKLHEMGFDFIKNHLSLVPEKVLDDLNEYEFPSKKYIKKIEHKNVVYISMEYAPFSNTEIGKKVKSKVEIVQTGRKVVILPKLNINKPLEEFCELDNKSKVYKYNDKNIEFFFIDHEHYLNRDKLFGHNDESEMIANFNISVIELLKHFEDPFDVINIHDWPLGLFPLLFENNLRKDMPLCLIEYTVYGPTYKGIYGVDVLKQFNIDKKYFDDHTVEHAMSVNLLISGLVTAQKIDMNKNTINCLKNSYLKAYVYDNM
jgi:hypothetical protein